MQTYLMVVTAAAPVAVVVVGAYAVVRPMGTACWWCWCYEQYLEIGRKT